MGTKGIVNIDIKNIYPHPDNPRKDLGDLTELSESIKKNGVMQNLTVISGHWNENKEWNEEGYTLIIGHRRHAASKLAGIQKLPCRIVEGMSDKEQMSTMLEENMQRNDLTIWEQAQGFQMMLDLGETETSISEKTGFSRTTIRHRLNIAKLDQQELQKKEKDDGFQLTLKDLYALEKIDDIDTRNKVLKEARDSRDLIWRAQCEVKTAERMKKTNEIVELLKEKGIKHAPKGAENEQYSGKWETVKEYDLEKEVPKRIVLPKTDETLYYLPHIRSVCVIKKAKKKPPTQYDIEKKERNKKKKEISAMMNEMNARCREFILNIISGKIEQVKETKEVQEQIWNALVEINTYISKSNMRRVFTGKSDYDCTTEEREETDNKINGLNFTNQMLAQLYYAIEHAGEIYDWQGHYNDERGKMLKDAFAVLERYGWYFEEDEEQLLNGTHELYEKE